MPGRQFGGAGVGYRPNHACEDGKVLDQNESPATLKTVGIFAAMKSVRGRPSGPRMLLSAEGNDM